MRLANIAVGAVLRSPIRGLLSGTTLLVRYEGRRSGRRVTIPTQYARVGNDLVIMVGGAGTKSWWRNFREEHRLVAQGVVEDISHEGLRMLLGEQGVSFPGREDLEDQH
jgi:hypothetical protein